MTADGRAKIYPPIGPVRVMTASQALAQQIRGNILAGKLSPGVSLAPERILVKQSGLSRASVREAIRILETEGLIETRPGRSGGAWVRRPDREKILDFLGIYIRTRRIPVDDLARARVAVESTTAEIAALRRTAEELAEIERLSEECVKNRNDSLLMKDANIAWHLAIARASHNEFMIAMFESLLNTIEELSRLDYVHSISTEHDKDASLRAHASIVEALRDRDAAAAKRRMERHLMAYGELGVRFAEAQKDEDDDGLDWPLPVEGSAGGPRKPPRRKPARN